MIKFAILITILLLACEKNDAIKFTSADVSNNSDVEINGKFCKIMIIKKGDWGEQIYFIDCGVGSSSSYSSTSNFNPATKTITTNKINSGQFIPKQLNCQCIKDDKSYNCNCLE